MHLDDIQRLVKKLKDMAEQIDIEKTYSWETPSSPLDIPDDIHGDYEKNVYLKHHLNALLTDDFSSVDYWIVRQWGGIKSFKQNQTNDLRIVKFKKQLQKGVLTRESFGLISSFSKIASFLYPENYAIYDSRVIYALNWLLLTHTDTHEFFLQPTSRNTTMTKYDMGTILRLRDPGMEYVSYKTSYHQYCVLMQELSMQVYGSIYPYLLEMLLFTAAPSLVLGEIMSSVNLIIDDTLTPMRYFDRHLSIKERPEDKEHNTKVLIEVVDTEYLKWFPDPHISIHWHNEVDLDQTLEADVNILQMDHVWIRKDGEMTKSYDFSVTMGKGTTLREAMFVLERGHKVLRRASLFRSIRSRDCLRPLSHRRGCPILRT